MADGLRIGFTRLSRTVQSEGAVRKSRPPAFAGSVVLASSSSSMPQGACDRCELNEPWRSRCDKRTSKLQHEHVRERDFHSLIGHNIHVLPT